MRSQRLLGRPFITSVAWVSFEGLVPSMELEQVCGGIPQLSQTCNEHVPIQ